MSNITNTTISQWDADHVWHPYASFNPAVPPIPVKSASGVHLNLGNGKQLIDGMASWWCAIHGYNVPELNAALQQQSKLMSHVMFGGLTHEPAAKLAKTLVDLTPPGLNKVFFSDSGSVAVEVALKMALQYWASQGHSGKHKIATVSNGYHGDTFAAMSVCDPVTGMHELFTNVLQQQHFIPAPGQGYENLEVEQDLNNVRELFERHHDEIAAFIIEPVVQGAGGMRIYNPQYLSGLRQQCDEFDILLIFDEIATGFGRTGKLFACEHAGVAPDIMTLGKAITGGYLSLAATLSSDKIARGIDEGQAAVLMHGPTFMGNPLACSVALASIELLLKSPWQQRVQSIETQLSAQLKPLCELPQVADVRCLGAIGVIEMQQTVDIAKVQQVFTELGVWLRPFGKLIYCMPPYVISSEHLSQLGAAMGASAEACQ